MFFFYHSAYHWNVVDIDFDTSQISYTDITWNSEILRSKIDAVLNNFLS